jgi:UDP-2-acetamido-3-amino-2,3-dideoxy-glucuronate N-acetyltransferase
VNTDEVFIHASAEVADASRIGKGTRVWHQAQVMPDVSIGEQCTLGKGAFIGQGTIMGRLVKVGNYASVFGAMIEDEAFIGPQVCILQDRAPRSTNPDGTRKSHADYVSLPATIRRGASIGAVAIILPGVIVGRYAMVAAGSVVNKDVPNFAFMAGNPARQIGYACLCGRRLDENLQCECGRAYALRDNELELVAGVN